ncbi:MAG: alkaline phosphatase family protein, partial [Spirochaetales bacterium]|nr:alkaline phosphatase family protein [Spirochaetales bacterium]
MKIIIFGFDGLRPDRINESSMPRLTQFLSRGVHCRNHRAVYPTETYVNHPSIFSGFLPERHGIISNAFFDPGISRTEYFLGSIVERVEQAEKETRHGLFRVPTLTETLARSGRSVVTLSSNSPGSTRLIFHRAGDVGGINIPINGIEYTLPETLRTELFGDRRSGKPPEPDLAGLKEINRLYRLLSARNGVPDLSILWYGEPDHAYHAFGIDAPESLEALKTADACFGEMLDEYARDDVQIVVASDHGHI